MAAYQVTFFGGVERSTIINVTLITVCTAPVIVASLSPLILNERPTPATLGALACALAGTVLLVRSGGEISLSSEHWVGNLLALGAAASYASFVMISKRALAWLDSFLIIAATFLVATLLLAPIAVRDVLAAGLDLGDWLYVLWLGLGSAALAYTLYIQGLPYASATAASVATLMEPLTASILASIFFGERLGALGLVGAALLLAGMILLFRRGA
jgi:DME family drug/metabolite transporter